MTWSAACSRTNLRRTSELHECQVVDRDENTSTVRNWTLRPSCVPEVREVSNTQRRPLPPIARTRSAASRAVCRKRIDPRTVVAHARHRDREDAWVMQIKQQACIELQSGLFLPGIV